MQPIATTWQLLACSLLTCCAGRRYVKAAKIADALARDVHYTVDEKQKSVLLTEDGYEAVEDVLQVRRGGGGILNSVCCCSLQDGRIGCAAVWKIADAEEALQARRGALLS